MDSSTLLYHMYSVLQGQGSTDIQCAPIEIKFAALLNALNRQFISNSCLEQHSLPIYSRIKPCRRDEELASLNYEEETLDTWSLELAYSHIRLCTGQPHPPHIAASCSSSVEEIGKVTGYCTEAQSSEDYDVQNYLQNAGGALGAAADKLR